MQVLKDRGLSRAVFPGQGNHALPVAAQVQVRILKTAALPEPGSPPEPERFDPERHPRTRRLPSPLKLPRQRLSLLAYPLRDLDPRRLSPAFQFVLRAVRLPDHVRAHRLVRLHRQGHPRIRMRPVPHKPGLQLPHIQERSLGHAAGHLPPDLPARNGGNLQRLRKVHPHVLLRRMPEGNPAH